MVNKTKKKIWIDLDNSPHVLFFRPIIEELQMCGIEVLLTARDRFQVCDLADLFNLKYKRIGQLHGKNRIFKLSALVLRALQLLPTILKEKPDLALAHVSRSQIILASLLSIPSIEIYDYEYIKLLPLLKPNWIIVPEIIPKDEILFNEKRILRYPGIKEDVYVPGFKPDIGIKGELGLNDKNILVTLRPPAFEAHYYKPLSNMLFQNALNFLTEQKDTQIVILPRSSKQTDDMKRKWAVWLENGRIIIPEKPINGLNLIWFSDLVISGGGTMNREATALGVPVYSIFGGKIGAVDKYLSDIGRLIMLRSVEDIHTKIILTKRNCQKMINISNMQTLNTIISKIKKNLDQ